MLPPADPLSQLNDGFHESYAARRRAVLATLGPALACVGDSLYLRIDGRREVGPTRTDLYHVLKTISHVPLTIQTILGDEVGALEAATRARLIELDRRIRQASATIGGRPLDAAQRARQQRLLAASQAFLAGVVAADAIDAGARDEFLGAQTADIRVNLADAARDQIRTMHATFGAWARAMTAAQWRQVRVVVSTSHMARTGNLEAQYFSLALGDRWEGRFEREDEHAGRRVLISEAALDEESAFALLATFTFDRRAANAFFGDAGRLGRDVLADATERLLAEMFAARPSGGGPAPG